MLAINPPPPPPVKNIQSLWADGEVMRFVGFPEGLQETEENLERWLEGIASARPQTNHYSIYEDGM